MASTTSAMMGSSRLSSRAFSAVRRAPAAARKSVRPQAMIRQYPDPEFMDWCANNFPENAVANPDEVRCLMAQGWTWLDVRPAFEYEDAGKVQGSVNIPIKTMTKKFVDGKKVYEKHDVDELEWITQVFIKFPSMDAKIMVGCSDGNTYSIDALMALEEAGYTNLVGIAGGYYEWFRTFDNKMVRRNLGEYQEKYDGEGADSCGIHASGAGFERVDAIEFWKPPQY